MEECPNCAIQTGELTLDRESFTIEIITRLNEVNDSSDCQQNHFDLFLRCSHLGITQIESGSEAQVDIEGTPITDEQKQILRELCWNFVDVFYKGMERLEILSLKGRIAILCTIPFEKLNLPEVIALRTVLEPQRILAEQGQNH